MNKLIYFGCILLLAACASKPEIIQRIPFNPSEFASLPTDGTATVSGQAYVRTADGKLYYPQDEQARLNPVTSYSKQWYEVNYLAKKNIADADPRYLEYVYKAEFDPQGRFNFKNIPAGDYYISAPIYWMEEYKMKDGSIFMKRRGVYICNVIHVEDGATLIKDITFKQTVNMASSQ